MDCGLNDEQQQLGDAERGWLAKRDPIERLRATLQRQPVSIDPAAVGHLVESGLPGLLTPDMGGTHVDLAVLAEAQSWAASSLPIADVALPFGCWIGPVRRRRRRPPRDGPYTALAGCAARHQM